MEKRQMKRMPMKSPDGQKLWDTLNSSISDFLSANMLSHAQKELQKITETMNFKDTTGRPWGHRCHIFVGSLAADSQELRKEVEERRLGKGRIVVEEDILPTVQKSLGRGKLKWTEEDTFVLGPFRLRTMPAYSARKTNSTGDMPLGEMTIEERMHEGDHILTYKESKSYGPSAKKKMRLPRDYRPVINDSRRGHLHTLNVVSLARLTIQCSCISCIRLLRCTKCT